jgi:hypothetical protein
MNEQEFSDIQMLTFMHNNQFLPQSSKMFIKEISMGPLFVCLKKNKHDQNPQGNKILDNLQNINQRLFCPMHPYLLLFYPDK